MSSLQIINKISRKRADLRNRHSDIFIVRYSDAEKDYVSVCPCVFMCVCDGWQICVGVMLQLNTMTR